MFFDQCKNENELKERFRILSKRFHPDLGGTNDLMKELMEDYEKTKNNPPWKVKTSPKGHHLYIDDPYKIKIKSILEWAKVKTFFDTEFIESLQDQFEEKGYLSDAQERAVDKIIKKFRIPILTNV